MRRQILSKKWLKATFSELLRVSHCIKDEVMKKVEGLTANIADADKPTVYMCGTSSYLTNRA